ncbi:type II secretion system protein GspF [Betaproteobacteria bacterium PRO7]|jgi:general secretion pathway protein F|nr:type II secretion system protein GspF [Betaproteobacteria bacterium PRO7]GIL04007.1 MAG: type II secretion system protein GspF [Betaproteobacteria bacterium]
MAAYRYAAADGSGKETTGVLEADSARAARQLLRGRGLVPLTVEPVVSEAQKQALSLALGRRLSQTELAVITRQLASLLGAALPVADALTVMVEQSEKQSVRELMAAIRTDVLGGSSLSKALARHPRQFPDIYRALIAAGEESGKLGSVLQSLADYIEERAKLQQKITLAFVYPAIVTFVALAVVIGLLTYVVPQVVQVFANTKQALPFLTRALIATSDFVRGYGWIVAALLAVGAFLLNRALRVEAVRMRWHQRILRLPVAGVLARSINTARFASTLSILVGSGVPMLRALQAAGETLTNRAMRARVVEATQRVREGFSLARALRADAEEERRAGHMKLFPPVLIHLIASGEATGKLPEMLARAADIHAREAERRALFFTSLLEPALILTMGVIVMLIVLAVLLPIIEINQLAR